MPKLAKMASYTLCDGGRYYPGTKRKLARVITADERELFYWLSEYCSEARSSVLLPTLINDSKTKKMKREDFL